MQMQCYIYRSLKRKGLYAFLAKKNEFSVIPKEIILQLGEMELTLEIELTMQKKLAKEDIGTVLENLKNKGFHLQMPYDIEDILSNISKISYKT